MHLTFLKQYHINRDAFHAQTLKSQKNSREVFSAGAYFGDF